MNPGETIHAPHLLDIEVVQVLRRFSLAGSLDGERAAEAIEDSDSRVARAPGPRVRIEQTR